MSVSPKRSVALFVRLPEGDAAALRTLRRPPENRIDVELLAQFRLHAGSALKRELGDAVSFVQPNGGLFFWARLTGANGKLADANVLAKRAIEKLVAFVPGAPFFAENPDVATLRLSFATADVAKIEKGVKRLGQAL